MTELYPAATDSALSSRRKEIYERLGLVAVYEANGLMPSHLTPVERLQDLSGYGHTETQIQESRRAPVLHWSTRGLWLQAIEQHSWVSIKELDLTAGFTIVFSGLVAAELADYGILTIGDDVHGNTVLDLCIDYSVAGDPLELTSNRDGTPIESAAALSEHRIRPMRWFYLTVEVTGAALVELRSRGNALVDVVTGVGDFRPASSQLAHIGESDGGDDQWEGIISGVYFASPALSAAKLAKLEAYVAGRLPNYPRDAATINAPTDSATAQDYTFDTVSLESPTGNTVTPNGAVVYGADSAAIGAPLAWEFAGAGRVDLEGVTPPELGDWSVEFIANQTVMDTILAEMNMSTGPVVTSVCIMIKAATGQLRIILMDDALNTYDETGPPVVTTRGGSHVVLVVNRVTGRGLAYVDAIEVFDAALPPGNISSIDDKLYIGQRSDGTLGCTGTITVPTVFDGIAISPERVDERYALAMGSLYLDAIEHLAPIASWAMDEKSGLIMVDRVGSADGAYDAVAATLAEKSPMGSGILRMVNGDGTDVIAIVPDADFPTAYETDDFTILVVARTVAAASKWLFGKSTAGGDGVGGTPDGFNVHTAAPTEINLRVPGVAQIAITLPGYADGTPFMYAIVGNRTAGTIQTFGFNSTGIVESATGVLAADITSAADFEFGGFGAAASIWFDGSQAEPAYFDSALTFRQLASIWFRIAQGEGLTWVPDTVPSYLLIHPDGGRLKIDGAGGFLKI